MGRGVGRDIGVGRVGVGRNIGNHVVVDTGSGSMGTCALWKRRAPVCLGVVVFFFFSTRYLSIFSCSFFMTFLRAASMVVVVVVAVVVVVVDAVAATVSV